MIRTSHWVTVCAVFGVLCWCGCCVTHRDRFRSQIATDLEKIGNGTKIFTDINSRPPRSLTELVDGPRGPYLDRQVLLNPHIPSIPSSNPPSSYHYIPQTPDAPSNVVIAFPNIRSVYPILVLRANGKIEELPPEDFKKELEKIGFDYSKLPEVK